MLCCLPKIGGSGASSAASATQLQHRLTFLPACGARPRRSATPTDRKSRVHVDHPVVNPVPIGKSPPGLIDFGDRTFEAAIGTGSEDRFRGTAGQDLSRVSFGPWRPTGACRVRRAARSGNLLQGVFPALSTLRQTASVSEPIPLKTIATASHLAGGTCPRSRSAG